MAQKINIHKMQNYKIYIVGSTGYLGSELCKNLKKKNIKTLSIGRNITADIYLDLSEGQLGKYNMFKQGDRVIYLSAISSPDTCSEHFEYSRRINVVNTSQMIETILEAGAIVLFASSDMVFGDSLDAVYEHSTPNPLSNYGQMKLEIEEQFKNHSNFFTMRPSYIFSIKDKFTRYLLDCIKKKESAKIYHPLTRSAISINCVIGFIMKFLEQPNICPEVINLAGPELLSRMKMAEAFKCQLGLNYYLSEIPFDFKRIRPEIINMRSKFLQKLINCNESYNDVVQVMSSTL